MQLTRFRTNDRDAWEAALARFAPNDDTYFQPGYPAACRANGDGEAECLLASEGGSALLLPVLRCPIRDGLFDIQGPYGYGGPLAISADAAFLARAWRAIREAWAEEGAVAAFLRCHPLIGNAAAFDPEWSVLDDRPTVSVDLRDGAGAAFAQPHARKHRRDVAQAVRSGATVRFQQPDPSALARFRALYCETMNRLGAGSHYFFSETYFETLARELGDALTLAEVCDAEGNASSMALIFWGPRWAHYHLGARSAGERNHNTFHLLFQRVAEEAERRGLEALHLGGGRTPAADDTLLGFKKRVGNTMHSFQTARVILHRDRYNTLASAWRAEHPAAGPGWFLAWRQPAPPLTKPNPTT